MLTIRHIYGSKCIALLSSWLPFGRSMCVLCKIVLVTSLQIDTSVRDLSCKWKEYPVDQNITSWEFQMRADDVSSTA